MIGFTEYEPTDEDIDKVKLAIVKLLFDNGLRLESGEFTNDKYGNKTINIVLTPIECEDKGDVE